MESTSSFQQNGPSDGSISDWNMQKAVEFTARPYRARIHRLSAPLRGSSHYSWASPDSVSGQLRATKQAFSGGTIPSDLPIVAYDGSQDLPRASKTLYLQIMRHILAQPMGVGVQYTCTRCRGSVIATAPWQAQRFVQHHSVCMGAAPGYYGMGDAVAAVAQPVARAVGLDPECAPCKQRQSWLNRLMPRLWRQ